MKNKKYIIIGSYGSSNIGDDELLRTILKHLKGNDVFALTGNINDTTNKYGELKDAGLHMPFGVRSFFSFKWLKSLKLIKAADIAILGGGGLFTDARTIKAPLLWAWQILWLKIYKKKIIIIGNSVGPLKTKIGKIVTKWSLKQCSIITLRDSKSYKIVTKMLRKIDNEITIKQCADLVFSNLDEYEKVVKQNKNNDKKITKIIALNLRKWPVRTKGINNFMKDKISEGYAFKLIAMEKNDTLLLKNYEQTDCKVITPKNYKALLKELNQCEYAIGMRLHFLIAAAVTGCKTGALEYSTKVSEVMKQLQLPYIDIKDVNTKNLKTLFTSTTRAKNLGEQKKESIISLNLLG